MQEPFEGEALLGVGQDLDPLTPKRLGEGSAHPLGEGAEGLTQAAEPLAWLA
jgi:hypothetical protein